MGLDVKVFKNVQITDSNKYDFIADVVDENWNDRIKNLKKGAKYVGERVKEIEIGYPCSYHNLFRDELCRFLGFSDATWRDSDLQEDTPFYEFFEFADNDGCIDWETSAKLWADFKRYEVEAIQYFESKAIQHTYLNWMQIFEIARFKDSVIVYS